MRLDEASVFLRLKPVQEDLKRYKTHVKPRGKYGGRCREVAVREQQVGNNSLRPGSPRLVRGGYDNVVVARTEVVPSSAVEVVALIDSTTLG